MKIRRSFLGLALGVATSSFITPSAVSQTVDAPDQKQIDQVAKQQVTAKGELDAEPDGTIGPDDLLDVTVPYCPELTRKFRVTDQGTLTLPLIKESLPVAGKRASEIGKLIADRLSAEGYLNNPVVIVAIAEYRSRPVTVTGAVNHPMTFQATGEVTLLDALTRAGGVSAQAGSIVRVTRKAGKVDAANPTVKDIPLDQLLSSSDPAVNLPLAAGDEVRVQEAGKIYVAGNVRHPGAYSLQRDSSMTVIKAIALSEGVEAFSSKWAYILRAQAPNTDPAEIKVPLSRILARKDPDMALMAGDIFYIPDSGGKKMTSKIISQITGFGQTAGAGILIYH